jgi:hypothetical protein
MIKASGKQFDRFTPVAIERGIIDNEYFRTMMICECADLLNGARTQKKEKPTPSKLRMIQKTINRIFSGIMGCLLTFQKAIPIFLFKDEAEHELK